MWLSRKVNPLLLIFFVWGSSASGDVRPSLITVNFGEGFLIRLVGKSDGVPLQNCQLTRNNKLYFLTPGRNETFALSTGELINPFDYNNTHECGIRVLGVGDGSKGTWKLSSIDMDGNERSGSAEVVITSDFGCPNADTNDCRFLSLNNDFLGSCDKALDDKISYKCDFFANGRMSRQSVIHLAAEKELPSPILKTQTGSTVFDCTQDLTEDQSVNGCYIEHVSTGTKYFIQAGLLAGRFSAYKTDFSLGVCQFEIVGEISEDEAGIWIISMDVATSERNPRYRHYYYNQYDDNEFVSTTESKTCKFHVKGNESLALQNLIIRTKSTEVVKTGENTTRIECAKSVFYPITVCYLLTQEGDVLFSENYDTFANGNCAFVAPPGNWTCGFNGPKEGDADFQQSFEVIQYAGDIIDESQKVADDGSLTVECHLICKSPIKVCMLVTPSGKVFRPPTDQFKSEEFSYYGGGSLSTGDCGITFEKDVEVESGLWKCIIVKMNDEKLSTEIFVPEELVDSN